MKIAAVLTRHRRLLALCGVSACAHLMVLELVAGRHRVPPARAMATDGLRLRLAPAGVPLAPVLPPPAALPAVPAAAPARVPRTAAGAPPSPAPRAAAPEAAALDTAAALPAQAKAPATAAAPADAGAPLIQMPGRYRVRLPEAVRLTYTLLRQAPGAAAIPAGQAQLDWRSDGDRYLMQMDGVLGRLTSEGGASDAGIAPRRALDAGTGGAEPASVTQFDAEGRRIVFGATGASVPDAVGAQDRGSVLMQLAGMGLAEPDQVRDEIRIVVAGSLHADIVRFRVLGQEAVQTGIGPLTAWRLAQLAAPGEAQLEVWLAPGQGWLPVQLRVTQPDGATATQTLAAIAPGRAP